MTWTGTGRPRASRRRLGVETYSSDSYRKLDREPSVRLSSAVVNEDVRGDFVGGSLTTKVALPFLTVALLVAAAECRAPLRAEADAVSGVFKFSFLDGGSRPVLEHTDTLSSRPGDGHGHVLLAQSRGNTDSGDDATQGKVIHDQQYRFAVPASPDGKATYRGTINHKMQVSPPAGPDTKKGDPANNDTKGTKANDVKNGDNGNGKKQDDAAPGPDRTVDAVQQG